MAEKENGFEEAGLCEAEVKNMPVAYFLGRGRIHSLRSAVRGTAAVGYLMQAGRE